MDENTQLPEGSTPSHDEEPERFDPALLILTPAERLEWFENECIIEHRNLLEALDAVLEAVCSPGENPDRHRLGTISLVIGPARVGKTALITLLEKQLLERARERMLRDPGHRPLVSISATAPTSGHFDWIDYYKAVLRSVNYPFLDRQRVRDLKDAMIEALIQHQPYAVIVDEAHHLAKSAGGRQVQDQLDHLKDLENQTGVSHVLVGTYDMRPFRKANAQLAGRSIDVHFPRYDIRKKEDRVEFQSFLWAIQRQLPVEEEPLLTEKYWEMLYARSIGCIGMLKLHLNRALRKALNEGARTVTEAHLEASAPSEDRLKAMLNTSISGEVDLTSKTGANKRLLELLYQGQSEAPSLEGETNEEEKRSRTSGSPPPVKQKVGKRKPGRDSTGAHPDQIVTNQEGNVEQVAG